jgi:hypothetical protein
MIKYILSSEINALILPFLRWFDEFFLPGVEVRDDWESDLTGFFIAMNVADFSETFLRKSNKKIVFND